MNLQKFAVFTLLPFGALSLYALWQVGYVGLFQYQLAEPAGWQVLCDLVVSLIIVLAYIDPELKRVEKSVLPWVALTLALGSFGPLLYLAFFRPTLTKQV